MHYGSRSTTASNCPEIYDIVAVFVVKHLHIYQGICYTEAKQAGYIHKTLT